MDFTRLYTTSAIVIPLSLTPTQICSRWPKGLQTILIEMLPNLTILNTHTLMRKTTPNTTASIIFGKRILEEDFELNTTNNSDFGRFEVLRKEKKRNVLSPIPSLATHCEVEWLAPIVDWEKIISNLK